jgi:DNA-binding PadR family transcriptional regulator
MRLSASLGSYPAARPLNADQILEYHAARLMLLFHLCGTRGEIHGLTKLAKLDFFVRYPDFFERAAVEVEGPNHATGYSSAVNDSTMVRHHYGPWDPRYYQVLAYLEGRELIVVGKNKNTFVFALTDTGRNLAKRLVSEASFNDLAVQMRKVKSLFGAKSGDWLKKLIYRVFDDEIAKLAKGHVIR